MDLQEIKLQVHTAVQELLISAKLEPGDILLVGCSTSEIMGSKIGTASAPQVGKAVLEGLLPTLSKQGIWLAAQCCEHLNRALIVEKEMAEAYRLEIVNAVPQPKAGGSFATAAWESFEEPVAVEALKAAAGLDIGLTLIGMNLRPVVVPVRLSVKKIGSAHLVAARTRPKYIGGGRTSYDERIG